MGQNALKIKWRVQPDATCTTAVQLKMFSAEFESLEELEEHAARWLWHYNHERPDSALGGITPAMKLKHAR